MNRLSVVRFKEYLKTHPEFRFTSPYFITANIVGEDKENLEKFLQERLKYSENREEELEEYRKAEKWLITVPTQWGPEDIGEESVGGYFVAGNEVLGTTEEDYYEAGIIWPVFRVEAKEEDLEEIRREMEEGRFLRGIGVIG